MKRIDRDTGKEVDVKPKSMGRFAIDVPTSFPNNDTNDRMLTQPGTYRSDSELRDSYAKSMDPKAIEKDVVGGAYVTPPTYSKKRNARKTGGFKGFKI